MLKTSHLIKVLCLILFLTSSLLAITQFSGNAFATTIATTGVKQDLINSIETALLNGVSGWTTVSGHGTTTLIMLSGTTPQGLQIRTRVRDNGGAGIQVYMENSNSTLTDTIDSSHGATLLATAGRIYQVIGSQYQFIIYLQGVARGFVWVGMPYLPSFLTPIITAAGFMASDCSQDADPTVRPSLWAVPTINDNNCRCNTESLLNANYWSQSNSIDNTQIRIGVPRLILNGVNSDLDMGVFSPTSYRWRDDSILTGDVYIAWGSTAITAEAKINGQIWDAIYISDSLGINTTATFSGHLFQNATDTNGGINSISPRGGIWFAVN